MSSPPNPLNIFRTYSYHHILVACDSSTTLDELKDVSEISRFQHPRERYCPQKTDSGGRYVVLINGMTDAQFFISDAKWSSVLIPKTGGSSGQGHMSTTLAVDGEMTIVEPRGVNLFNLLNQVTKSLQIDPSAMMYMLKTVFVGPTYAGTTETITTIRPLPFVLTDITAQFDNTGATYNISFVGQVNGAGKLPYCNAIVEGFSGEINGKSTLYDELKSLERQIQTLYDNRKMKVINAAKSCGTQVDPEKEFMKVKYVIKPDPIYRSFTVGDNLSSMETTTGEDNKQISDFGDGTSIESLIATVMMSSKQVLEEQNGEPGEVGKKTERYMFKVTSSVKIDRSAEGERTYVVEYNVHRYAGHVIPADEIETWSPNGNTPDDDPDAIGITFDYIFSGENIDILDFDLDMQYGLTFMQMLGTHTSAPVTSHDRLRFDNPDTFVSGVGNMGGPGDQEPPSSYCNDGIDGDNVVKKPLFLGTMVSHPSFRDTRTPGATASYNTLLHRIAALENIGARFKIRGNPQLLEDTTQHPEDVDVDLVTNPILADNSERTVFPRGHTVPGFVKINVYMPNEWQYMEDSASDAISRAAGDYAQQFWYKGWYMLLQIDHVFSEGDFTQELEVYSLPTDAGESVIGKCIDEAVDPQRQTSSVSVNDAATSEGTASSLDEGSSSIPDETRQVEEKNTIADTQSRRNQRTRTLSRRRN